MQTLLHPPTSGWPSHPSHMLAPLAHIPKTAPRSSWDVCQASPTPTPPALQTPSTFQSIRLPRLWDRKPLPEIPIPTAPQVHNPWFSFLRCETAPSASKCRTSLLSLSAPPPFFHNRKSVHQPA